MYLYLKDVATLKIDANKCTGCGFCLNVCPRNVIGLKGGKAFIAIKDACLECGACAKNCRFGAITVQAGVGCATALLRGGDCGCGENTGCCGQQQKTKKNCCGK